MLLKKILVYKIIFYLKYFYYKKKIMLFLDDICNNKLDD